MEGKNFECPSCGGTLRFDTRLNKLICEHCKNTYLVREIIKNDESRDDFENDEYIADYFDKEAHTVQYTCEGCGGQIVVEENVVTASCPFCGNNVLLKQSLAGAFRPKYIVPFTKTKEDIEGNKNTFTTRNIFLPWGFKRKLRKAKVSGIYIPLYLLNGTLSFEHYAIGYLSGDGGTPFFLDDNLLKKMNTRYGKISFNHLPVIALEDADNKVLEAMGPLDLTNMLPFETPYLAGHMARRLNQPLEKIRPLISSSLEKEVFEYLLAYDKKNMDTEFKNMNTEFETKSLYEIMENMNRPIVPDKFVYQTNHVDIDKLSGLYILYPLWFMNVTYKDKSYEMMINDKSKIVYGELPLSKIRLIFFTILFSVLYHEVFFWIFGLHPDLWIVNLVFSIIIGITLGVATAVGVYKSYYVHKKYISHYIEEGSYTLSKNKDKGNVSLINIDKEIREMSQKIYRLYSTTNIDYSQERNMVYQISVELEGKINIAKQIYDKRLKALDFESDTITKEEAQKGISDLNSQMETCEREYNKKAIHKRYYEIQMEYYSQKKAIYEKRIKYLEKKEAKEE